MTGLSVCLLSWVLKQDNGKHFHVLFHGIFQKWEVCHKMTWAYRKVSLTISIFHFSCRDSGFLSTRLCVHLHWQENWAGAWQNQQNDLCAHWRLGSGWASVQSDQSLRCALSGKLGTQGFFRRTAKTDQTGRMPWNWSESLLGTQVILLALSCCGSVAIDEWSVNIQSNRPVSW